MLVKLLALGFFSTTWTGDFHEFFNALTFSRRYWYVGLSMEDVSPLAKLKKLKLRYFLIINYMNQLRLLIGLVVTAALLQSIIPIAIGQQWSLFNRFKSNRTTTTKSVNAEETVRQASRASATNEDHNFVS
ncbi:hypothetical protein H8356DRAFT_1354440 [Neocallimastix lanati (nom. inval.)]|nr:hypothetical protein H8356DRAFT_1354440 [Neocallimastix sp. JGI-2020a]